MCCVSVAVCWLLLELCCMLLVEWIVLFVVVRGLLCVVCRVRSLLVRDACCVLLFGGCRVSVCVCWWSCVV